MGTMQYLNPLSNSCCMRPKLYSRSCMRRSIPYCVGVDLSCPISTLSVLCGVHGNSNYNSVDISYLQFGSPNSEVDLWVLVRGSPYLLESFLQEGPISFSAPLSSFRQFLRSNFYNSVQQWCALRCFYTTRYMILSNTKHVSRLFGWVFKI